MCLIYYKVIFHAVIFHCTCLFHCLSIRLLYSSTLLTDSKITELPMNQVFLFPCISNTFQICPEFTSFGVHLDYTRYQLNCHLKLPRKIFPRNCLQDLHITCVETVFVVASDDCVQCFFVTEAFSQL